MDEHCLQDLEADINVPLRHVVSKWSVKESGEVRRLMFLHVCIHNQKQEASVEELSKEHTLCNECFLS